MERGKHIGSILFLYDSFVKRKRILLLQLYFVNLVYILLMFIFTEQLLNYVLIISGGFLIITF